MACSLCEQEGHTKRTCKSAVGKPDPVLTGKLVRAVKSKNPDLAHETLNYVRYTRGEYYKWVKAIKEAAKLTNIDYSKDSEEDGRLDSAVKEKAYFNTFVTHLPPDFKIDRPKARVWYDIMINGIPINLKLTTGKADNAFNKKGVEATLAGGPDIMTNQNTHFNQLYSNLKKHASKERNLQTEYHYLVVNKITGDILFKPLLDIHTYKTNPSNIMQIDWKNEFSQIAYKATEHKAKIRELLKVIQSSLKQWYDRSKVFINADIDADFA